ncbi:MAG: hypothetical protein KDK39_19390, partial [Leptospiraceae bacterium]|nr:hypothetical protein [Leptospiraceae bacterium]
MRGTLREPHPVARKRAGASPAPSDPVKGIDSLSIRATGDDRVYFFTKHYYLYEWNRLWKEFFQAWKFQHNRHLHHYFQPRLQAGLRYWEGRIDRCSLIASSRSVRRRRGFQPIAD